MKWKTWFRWSLAISLLALTAVVRTYRLDTPLADWHSSRQADTAAVARNFVQDEFNLLLPRTDSIWPLSQTQIPNPQGYFMNEFPLYNGLVALVYQYTGVDHVYGRLVSIGFAVAGAWGLYGLASLLLGPWQGVAALALYAVLPYNIYYGRVFMPDPAFVSLSVISLFWCAKYVKSQKLIHGLLMSVFLALAMLVKPYAVFIAIPIVYWLVVNLGLKAITTPSHYLFLAIAFTPLYLWRAYITGTHPEGVHANAWLLNQGEIRFKGAFFRWIIYDRFNRLIFATGGFVLFILGFFRAYLKKPTSFFFVWTLAIFTYITVFAKGNVNHDYYQLPIVAPGVVLMVIGAEFLIKQAKSKIQLAINTGFVAMLVIISLAFGWFEVRSFFNINNMAIVAAGARADQILPPDAIVIAPYMGDIAFLYQINRTGWPVGGNIDERIENGATHYVTTSFDDEFNELKAKYTLLEQTDDYAIIQL